MKKITAIILILLMLLPLAACGKTNTDVQEQMNMDKYVIPKVKDSLRSGDTLVDVLLFTEFSWVSDSDKAVAYDMKSFVFSEGDKAELGGPNNLVVKITEVTSHSVSFTTNIPLSVDRETESTSFELRAKEDLCLYDLNSGVKRCYYSLSIPLDY